MPDVASVLADLRDESSDLDALVAGLTDAEWRRETPAPGWTIAHQIGHLTWTDATSTVAVTDAAAYQDILNSAATDPFGFVDAAAESEAARAPADLLDAWRQGRTALSDALAAVTAGTKVPWFGPPMSAPSMATARLMETWAHGQDVADTLHVTRTPTARLRHVAHLGVRTRDFAYLVRDLPVPPEPFRVELTGPDGDTWTWGPDDAAQRVTGPALDFCLLVTQRRHRADLAVTAVGTDADAWLDIAQAFAGPPGPGRPKGPAS